MASTYIELVWSQTRSVLRRPIARLTLGAMTTIDHITPAGLPLHPAFGQALAVRSAEATIHVGSRNRDTTGGVGPDARARARPVSRTLETVHAGAPPGG